MRILYIYQTATIHNFSSVQNKIISQIKAANLLGQNVTGLFFTTQKGEFPEVPNVHFYRITEVNKGWFRSIRQNKNTYQEIRKVLKEIAKKEDKIYLRYWGIGMEMLRLAKEFKGKIVWNHLTAETKEIAMYSSDSPSIYSRFLSKIEFKWFPIFMDKTIGKFTRRYAGKAVVNSMDIAEFEQKMCLGKYECAVIPDAVDSANMQVAQLHPLSTPIRMVFLKGASGAAEYNGLDRLVRGIAEYVGELQFHLTIIGGDLIYEKALIQKYQADAFVTLKAAMLKNEIDAEIGNYNLAVGQLGMHKKGIRSNSTLKTREYFARGIPFIFAHHDPDFSDSKEALKYCLELPADDKPIDLHVVLDFLNKVYKIENVGEKMHNYAIEYLDYSAKMKQIVDFILR